MSVNHSAMSHFLNRLSLRSKLSAVEREAILNLTATVRQYRPRHDIIRPGQETEHATLVGQGLVSRFDAMRGGARQLTALYIRGDMCDLHSVVSPIAGWGLMALNNSTILEVPHSELKEITAAFPAIAFAFWRDTTVDASILSKWLGNLGRNGARKRIAHLVCEMGLRMETAGLGERNAFTLDMSQYQLGEMTGLTAVHVNRTFQELRREQVFSTNGRQILVEDWERLRAEADFDPTYLLMAKKAA